MHILKNTFFQMLKCLTLSIRLYNYSLLFFSEHSMSGDNNGEGHVIRIRGLPWSASEDDVIKFFGGARSEWDWRNL